MMGNSQNKTKGIVLDKTPAVKVEEYIEDEDVEEEDVEEDLEQPVVNVVDETTDGESAPNDLENGTPDEPVTEEQGSQENPLIKLPVPDKNTSFHLLIAFINLAFSRGAYTQEEVEKIIECINMFTV